MCEMLLQGRMLGLSGEGGAEVCICTLSIFLGPKIGYVDEALNTNISFLYERIANILVSACTENVFTIDDQTLIEILLSFTMLGIMLPII